MKWADPPAAVNPFTLTPDELEYIDVVPIPFWPDDLPFLDMTDDGFCWTKAELEEACRLGREWLLEAEDAA